jgi:hypothetical protein
MKNTTGTCMNNRQYSAFAEGDAEARELLGVIANKSTTVEDYKRAMTVLGEKLAAEIAPKISNDTSSDVYVVCTVEDADFLGRGVISKLESLGFGSQIKLMCLWNANIREEGVSLSPILRQYKEESNANRACVIVVKSIISGACVVKTNLARALTTIDPEQVFIASPVLLEGAQERLADEFPKFMSHKFQFVWMATDSEKIGEEVIPGIGGSVYERLGFENSKSKNTYVPIIVKQRRKVRFQDTVDA